MAREFKIVVTEAGRSAFARTVNNLTDLGVVLDSIGVWIDDHAPNFDVVNIEITATNPNNHFQAAIPGLSTEG